MTTESGFYGITCLSHIHVEYAALVALNSIHYMILMQIHFCKFVALHTLMKYSKQLHKTGELHAYNNAKAHTLLILIRTDTTEDGFLR